MGGQQRKSIRDRYDENFLLYELIISLIVGALLFVIVQTNVEYISIYDKWMTEIRSTLFPLIASIAGTLLGFIITAVSVIVSFFQTKDTQLSRFEGRPILDDIYGAYMGAIYVLAIATALSIIGIYVNEQILHWISFLILWSVLISSLRIWRCLWTLKNLIDIIKLPKNEAVSQSESNVNEPPRDAGPITQQ